LVETWGKIAIMKGIQWPSFSGHPPAPWLDNEAYSQWILNEWIPLCAERGEMTEEKLIADFMNNEGRVTSWPDFGAVRDKSP
jgi:hypothetical protein